jgi:hypothetical protein
MRCSQCPTFYEAAFHEMFSMSYLLSDVVEDCLICYSLSCNGK